MPHYLIRGSYTAEGAKGLIAEGGSGRAAAASSLIESMGGSVESVYFIWGDDDVIAICELPDDASAAAASLAASTSDKIRISVTPLLTPADVDAAAQKASGADYRPPGG